MNTEAAGTLGLIGIILIAALALCAIIMPVVVIFIDCRVARIQKTLAAMEHMMRYGK